MPPVRQGTKEALIARGAVDHGNYLNRHITHLICDNYEFQQHICTEYLKPPDMNFFMATSEWVRWSVLCGTQLPTRPFSYRRIQLFVDMIFGVGGDSSFLQLDDRAKLWAMINFYGGRWSSRIDRCTHLIVANCPPGDVKNSDLCAFLVTPSYVVECILGMRHLDERLYNPGDFRTSVELLQPHLSIRTNNLNWWSKLKRRKSRQKEKSLLNGCYFHFIDYEYLVPMSDIAKWKQIVQKHGGSLVKHVQEQRLTHLVCENRHSDLYKRALACGRIKLVTAYWLLDVVKEKEQYPPWLPYHYPLMYSQLRRKELPLRRHVVHTSNMDVETDRTIQKMIILLGGTHSNTLTSMCSIVISGSSGDGTQGSLNLTLKVNQRWIVELFFGNDLMNKNLNFKFINPQDECTVYNFDRCFVSEFLAPWMTLDPSMDVLNISENSNDTPPRGPSSKCLVKVERLPRELQLPWHRNEITQMKGCVVAFTGFSERQLQELKSLVSRIPGGKIADDDFEVTHLIAKHFVKTTRFLTCISICCYVVNYKWLLDSQTQGHYIHPPDEYRITDDSEMLSKGLALSNPLNRQQPIFLGLSFFCMPNVQPPAGNLKNPILAAGGSCLTDLAFVLSTSNAIIIARIEDCEILLPLIKRGVNVQSVRFILDNLFAEEIDFDSYQINELTS